MNSTCGLQMTAFREKCTACVCVYSLGTLLMALRGLSTRTVLMAEKLMFWRSREYSTILGRRNKHTLKISVTLNGCGQTNKEMCCFCSVSAVQ